MVLRSGVQFSLMCSAVLAASGLTACGGPGPSATPRASATPSGCKSLQQELKRYERKGVAAWAEAKNAGRKLSKSKEADLRIYNDLLNKYLGGKCHL